MPYAGPPTSVPFGDGDDAATSTINGSASRSSDTLTIDSNSASAVDTVVTFTDGPLLHQRLTEALGVRGQYVADPATASGARFFEVEDGNIGVEFDEDADTMILRGNSGTATLSAAHAEGLELACEQLGF